MDTAPGHARIELLYGDFPQLGFDVRRREADFIKTGAGFDRGGGRFSCRSPHPSPLPIRWGEGVVQSVTVFTRRGNQLPAQANLDQGVAGEEFSSSQQQRV